MTTSCLFSRFHIGVVLMPIIVLLFVNAPVLAQGSIFGQVVNSDLTVPADSTISFFGFLNNSDEEIRIESSIGAGFDNMHWYDDFQNFLTESPGLPYRYCFKNMLTGESFVLSKTIPSNSYQQEDIILEQLSEPDTPEWVSAQCSPDSQIIILTWQDQPNTTFHIYSRIASIKGSFFRIDDPSGSLSSPGVSGTSFSDNVVGCDGIYQYLLIAENQDGQLSPHSDTPDRHL